LILLSHSSLILLSLIIFLLWRQVVVEEETFDRERRAADDAKLMARFAGVQLEAAGGDAALSQKELDQ
jgi:hypothetical protein